MNPHPGVSLDQDLEFYAQRFKALSNPNRLLIFRKLMVECRGPKACGPTDASCVGDLARDLDIAPSTLSHHLKELRQAGLLVMKRRGTFIVCRMDERVLEEMADFFFPTSPHLEVKAPG